VPCKVLENLCKHFHVDVTKDHGVVSLISYHFHEFVEYNTDLEVNLGKFLVHEAKVFTDIVSAEIDRISGLETCPPILMCSECLLKCAVTKCVQCRDAFCEACFRVTHSTGKWRNHETTVIDQKICAVCSKAWATCQLPLSENVAQLNCDKCYDEYLVRHPHLQNETKRYLNSLACQECGIPDAGRLCEDCEDLFCLSCWQTVHLRGRMRLHSPITITPSGEVWRGGSLVNSADIRRIVNKTGSIAQRNEWVGFLDEGFTRYWYNFSDSVRSNITPLRRET
jgi:hypothetical protein